MPIELWFWIGIGIADIIIKVIWRDTISKWVERQLPRLVDVFVVIGIIAAVWASYGPDAATVALRYILIGHMLLGHETYGK